MKKIVINESTKDLIFRAGLGSIFLVNSLTAWISADEFLDLIKNNALASVIAKPEILVRIAGINDGLLFLLILSGRWRKIVAVWAAAWLVVVIYVSGFGWSSIIEHLGVLAFILYYFLTDKMSSANPKPLNQ